MPEIKSRDQHFPVQYPLQIVAIVEADLDGDGNLNPSGERLICRMVIRSELPAGSLATISNAPGQRDFG